jgi:hypothetical protein
MERNYLKKYLNQKVYQLAKIKLSKSSRPEQSNIDDLIDNFDENEDSFKDLDEAKDFLSKHKKSVVVDPKKLEEFKSRAKKKSKQKDTNWLLYLGLMLAFVIFVKYFFL